MPVFSLTRASGRSPAAQATRQLMYQVLPSGVPALVTGAPEGVVWQALASAAQGRTVRAFTTHPSGVAQIGNQAEQWSAVGTCSSNSCSFASQRQTDALFLEGITELACWVHVRRKFVEVVQASGSPLAQEAVERIGALYRIEAEAREHGLPGEALRAYRQQQATARLTELHDWLQALGLKALKNSGLATAVNHALSRWPALLRYLENGGRPIDNNPIENAIRPITLGRKNWLFIGGTKAGPRAAAIMSLVATAKANGVCPQAWLTDVLTRLPTTRNRDIDSLLPTEGWVAVSG